MGTLGWWFSGARAQGFEGTVGTSVELPVVWPRAPDVEVVSDA